MLSANQIKIIKWALRIGVFGTFIGHGLVALGGNPGWIPLITAFGFSKNTAIILLPLIGIADILVALFSLYRPFRIVLVWASFWGFATALSRPIAGEPILEFIERTPNWIIPLSLLALHEFTKKHLMPEIISMSIKRFAPLRIRIKFPKLKHVTISIMAFISGIS